MRQSKMLAKWRAGQSAKVAMLGHFIPAFVAYAARAGYDGIWLDLEHRPMDSREIQALLGYFHLYDIDCMLRPPTREKAALYRYYEDGVSGLIIPHVNDIESAQQLVSSTKFPPIGDRGYEGRSLESNFGLDTQVGGREALVQHALRETFLVLMVETPSGIAAAPQIAALNGVDALFLGPADLSIRLPYAQPPLTLPAAIDQVKAAAEDNGKPWGLMPHTLDDLRRYHTVGARLLPWGNEQTMLLEGVRLRSTEFDSLPTGADQDHESIY
jgi:4-hydroxy-2-oxoheptanedioate aldolase